LRSTITLCWRNHILAANITSACLDAPCLHCNCAAFIAQPGTVIVQLFHHSLLPHPNAQSAKANPIHISDLTHAHPPPVSNWQRAAHLPSLLTRSWGLFSLADLPDGAWTPRKLQKASLEFFYVDFCARPEPRHSQGAAKGNSLPTSSLGSYCDS
jgi:hypothetical protein